MKASLILVASLMLTAILCFPYANNKGESMNYYESNSFDTIIHLHFNHHFKDSPQFIELEIILNSLYANNKDFMKILYTDCDQDKGTPSSI